MTNKILAFGASNSSTSINKKLANYAAHLFRDSSVELLDLNDYEMPIYSIDRERQDGIPQLALDFKEKVRNCDAIVISFAEHNGAYSVAFKNVMDWMSRIEKDTWASKPMLLLATSPGARGGSTVLEIAVNKFGFMNSNLIASFSLPSFNKNFDASGGIHDPDLLQSLQEQIDRISQAIRT